MFQRVLIRDINRMSGQTKVREICNPGPKLRALHNRLRSALSLFISALKYTAGCRRGDSPKKRLQRHLGHTHFYLVDLRDAYHAVRIGPMAELLARISPDLLLPPQSVLGQLNLPFLTEKEAEVWLTANAFDNKNGGLLVGAPASPDLFNLYADCVLDTRLSSLAQRYGMYYSRYLDDLLFSSEEDNSIGQKKRRAIRAIIADAGFAVSDHKSKLWDIRKGPIFVNGVGLDYTGRFFVPGKFIRRLKGVAFLARRKVIPANRVQGMLGAVKPILAARRPNRSEHKAIAAAASVLLPKLRMFSPPKLRWWERF